MMKIRTANLEDTKGLIALWDACDLTRPWNDPAEDIKLALKTVESEIFVGLNDKRIIASVLCGFDGHRGWIYFVAVDPDFQKQGYSRQIVTTAEEWLLSRGCPKVELIIREGNNSVQEIYQKLGYKVEPRILMSKWLKEPPAPHADTKTHLTIAVTYLEMTERPTKTPVPLPSLNKPISLTRVHDMSVSFFRYLYNTVGEKWFWWEKRVMSDDELYAFINKEGVEFYLLNVGGMPAGFVQFSFPPAFKDGAEISFFGLLPDFIGMGLGSYLLDWAIETCWSHSTQPHRIFLDTCTMDHPGALPNYQKAGFVPYNQKIFTIPDPRINGIIPKNIPLAQPEPNISRS